MKPRIVLSLFILILFNSGCGKDFKNNPGAKPEGTILLSDIETRHDYYLPFALENDISDVNSVSLNNETPDFTFGRYLDFPNNDFYELLLKYKDVNRTNDTILFTTKTEEREASEWGIRTWVPVPIVPGGLTSEDVEVFYPHTYSDSIKIPFIFYIKEAGKIKSVYCTGTSSTSKENFNIKRGVGSTNINSSLITTGANFTIGGRHLSIPLAKNKSAPFELNGTISTGMDIPSNSVVRITGNLNIASTGSITVHSGVLFIIDEAVDINVSGPVRFLGTASDPVLVTCRGKNKFWGGFITKVAGGIIEAHYTIFSRSGYHDTAGYDWGHAGRQALFYTGNSSLTLDHCYITDHIGQVFYPENSTLTFDNILVQRVKTGGQLNHSDLNINNSIFTDFPDDSRVFADDDNDALYLNATNAIIENSTFMFAKDDGLDSGADEGGIVTVTNCRFEACFHEGAALSSISPAVKSHSFTGCVFTNCGQGLELGYSSPGHNVVADNCMFIGNGTGIRYGDNYDWSEVNGKMHIKNSSSLNNDRDVWNMVRKSWSPKLENLSFENTRISKFTPQYPGLEISDK